jgi:hypothetical protein
MACPREPNVRCFIEHRQRACDAAPDMEDGDVQMPTRFKMIATDPLIQTYLTIAERGQINPQQAGDTWDFEFHGGHETGTPLYIRPNGNKATHNLTKFDTHTIDGQPLAYNAGNIINPEHVDAMKSAARNHLYAVVAGNWGLLRTVSWRFKRGDRNGEIEQANLAAQAAAALLAAAAAAAAPTTKACKFPPCPGHVPIVRQGKAPCDTCWQYQ